MKQKLLEETSGTEEYRKTKTKHKEQNKTEKS